MSFLLRAALVIGALSYFALSGLPGRGGVSGGVDDGADIRRQAQTLSAALKGLPAEVGGKAMQAAGTAAGNAAATAVEAEILRRLVQTQPSQDTLAAADRRPSWRGAQER